MVTTALLVACGLTLGPARSDPGRTPALITNRFHLSLDTITMGRRGVVDRAELEAFLDGVIEAEMVQQHVAGATVAIVKNGTLFFAKGYGYADVETHRPVDAERTLFRVGSVSKLFTWTAVMQLVEQGKLDLDTDVNRYLDFAIPPTYPEPITLKHLMTHTAGFEEDARELIGDDTAQMRPMAEWLPRRMPARVRPPGTYSSYSNWGTALAGYIVQRVSGQSFEEYLEQHILGPLGMTHTSTRQPLPPSLSGDMSQGYEWKDGRYFPHKWEILIGAVPAGSITSTATDMARFMVAHLQDGRLGEQRILSQATAQRMHTRVFGHDPRLPGFALGFYEKDSHGLHIIGHGGDSQWFHTDLALIPSESLGVFVSYNTDTGANLSAGPFLESFLDHYYPAAREPVTLPANFARGAAKFAGVYQSNRNSYTTFMKALNLSGATSVEVTDSALIMRSSDTPIRLVPIDSLLFRNPLDGGLVAFKQDAQGHVTHAFIGSEPMIALEKQSASQSPRLHLMILGGCVVLFAGLLVGGVRRGVRALRGKRETPPPAVQLGRRFLLGAALANLVFVAAVMAMAPNATVIILGNQLTPLKIALAFPVLGLLLALGAGAAAVQLWRRSESTLGARLGLTAIVALTFLFAWSLNQWNLLGWRL